MVDRNLRVIQRMRKEAALILSFISDMDFERFRHDEKTKRAVTQTLANLGELENIFDKDFKERHPQIPWPAIRRTRNIIAHDYISVNFETVWQTATESIPELLAMLQDVENSEQNTH